SLPALHGVPELGHGQQEYGAERLQRLHHLGPKEQETLPAPRVTPAPRLPGSQTPSLAPRAPPSQLTPERGQVKTSSPRTSSPATGSAGMASIGLITVGGSVWLPVRRLLLWRKTSISNPLVPKQPRKCYLIDSLSLALRHKPRFYAVCWHLIDPFLTFRQVFSSREGLPRGRFSNCLPDVARRY